jgi:methylphosphotriester-DNA--protein-cysteine methyltransferase
MYVCKVKSVIPFKTQELENTRIFCQIQCRLRSQKERSVQVQYEETNNRNYSLRHPKRKSL